MTHEQHILNKLANGQVTSFHLIRSIMSKFKTTQEDAIFSLGQLLLAKRIRYDIKNEQNYVSLGSMSEIEMLNYLAEMRKILNE